MIRQLKQSQLDSKLADLCGMIWNGVVNGLIHLILFLEGHIRAKQDSRILVSAREDTIR